MKPAVSQVEVDLTQSHLYSHKLRQLKHPTDIKPIFSSKSKCLFVAAGNLINVYSSYGGELINVLEKHKEKIIGICSNHLESEEQIISCDEKLNLFHWNVGSSNEGNLLCLPLPNQQKSPLPVHFWLSINLSYLVGFIGQTSRKMKLFHYTKPYKNMGTFITNDVIKAANAVDTSCDGMLLAAVKEYQLYVSKYPYNVRNDTRYHRSGKRLQCLVFHPSDYVIAVGDVTGAITLWYNVLNKYPVKSVIHWHSLRVSDLSFSTDGTELFSGGGECVVVCWHLSENNHRSFLPRLGSPICLLNTDSTNTYLAVLHVDKSISIINARELALEGLIKTLSIHIPRGGGKTLPLGLLHHPKSNSLIMNSKTGHIQFFQPSSGNLLYNLDITMNNFVSDERNERLPNPEVILAAVTDDGSWLITVEDCILTHSMLEIYLKFWAFSDEDQRWELNTSIQMPHTQVIKAIALQSLGASPACVTASEDRKFKLWKLIEYLDVQGKTRKHWNCQVSREFRGLASTAAAFAPDDSLIAVAFESVITLWTHDSDVTFVGALLQDFIDERINDIMFSYGERQGSYLVTRSDNWLYSWDLLSCSLRWRVSLGSSCMAVEKSMGVAAVFSKADGVFFFESHSSKPISRLETPGVAGEVLGAAFVPSEGKMSFEASTPWRSNSSLHFIDGDQTLFSVSEEEDGMETSLAKNVQNSLNRLTSDHSRGINRTLYSALIAKTQHVTRKSTDAEFIPTLTSTNVLLEHLNQVNVYNMESMMSLASFLSMFPPNLEQKTLEAGKNPSLTYTTIKEGYEPEIQTEPSSTIDSMVEAVQKISYQNIVTFIQS